MSLSNLQTFNNSAEFEQKRFDILEWLEGNILTPYFDTKGLITIGIGFQIDTIIDNRNFVMGDAGMNLTLAQEAAINAAWESTAMTRIKALPQATETQRQAKDAALCAYLDSVLGTRSFAMTDPQIKNVFDVLVLKHQDKITSLISTPSIEQIVLTSLHYNSPGLVGPGLKAAMNMADPSEARAEAWFQIRYDHKDEPKLQKRRYAEAALFGLYDADGTVSLDEAKAIYRMYTRHANEILKSGVTMENFDAKYSTKMSQANADLAGYGFSGKIAKNLDGELALACSTILSDLDNNTNQDIKNAYRKWASNAENLLLFSPTNLLVDPKTGAVSSLLDGRNITSNSVIIGDGISIVGAAGSGGDMMLGGMGNDLLIGGAGNDVIWGSSGRDVMAGGAGNDTYILDGSTQVTIEDKIGNNRVLLNGVVLSVFYRQSDGTYKSFDGKIHGAFSGGDFIVTDSNGAQIVLNEDFQSGDFGIALIDSESQTTPVTTRTIVGDYGWFDVDPETAGIQFDRDVLGNPIQDLNKPSVMDDDLNGSIGNDLILPGSGEDRVYAQAGDDQIEAGSGRDIVDGSSGDDLIQGNMGGDILIGGAGSDRLYGDNVVTETQAIINGNDDIGTGLQGDWLAGNSGDDTLITGAGNDVLTGGGGQDRLIAGAGDDDILGDSDWVAQSHDWMVTYVSNVRHYQPVSGVGIALDGAADVIYAGAGNDHAFGGFGNDVILGEVGNDYLSGGDGSDIVIGGDGDDTMFGDGKSYSAQTYVDEGDDFLDGGAGDDTLYGGGGADTLIGGDGMDTLFGDASDISDNLQGDDFLDGGAGDDRLVGGGGSDRLLGDIGNDILFGGGGADTLIGGNGNDTLSGDTDDISDVVTGDDYLDGGDGNDILTGGGGSDVLIGGDGADQLYGESSDTPAADQGDDFLDGGAGNDILNGGGGNDTLLGGDGNDKLYGDADITPLGALGNDYLYGGAGDDTMVGDGGSDTLYGGDGNDTMDGDAAGLSSSLYGDDYLDSGAGDDSLIGGGGADRLYGGDGIDVLQGDGLSVSANGDDYLDGGAGNDTLYGDGGNDYLIGATGNDWLEGNEGDDIYLMQVGDGIDRIADSSGKQNLIFSGGISASDISVTLSNGMAYVRYSALDYLIMDVDSLSSVQMVEFSDGSTLTSNQLMDKFIPGTSSIGALNLGTGVTFSEISYFGVNGNLIIAYDGGLSNWIDTAGLNAAGVLFQIGDGLDYGLSVSKPVLVLNNWYQSNPSDYVSQIKTSTGNVSLTSVAPVGRSFIGTTGVEVINATIGDDVITGGAGADVLYGGAGNDIYKYALGDGRDTIIDASGSLDKLKFGPGINSSDLAVTLTTDGLNIVVGQDVNGDSVLIRGWTDSNTNYIDVFSFDDGSSLTAAQIEGLVIGNHRPVVISPLPDQVVGLEKIFSISFSGSFIDNDIGDTLTYTASLSDGTPLPSWMNINSMTQTLSGTSPSIERAGPVDVVITAADQNGLYRSDKFTLMVGLNSIVGTDLRDRLYGDAANNTIIGYAGEDDLYGDIGDDSLNGGDENDFLYGGLGNDVSYGGKGNDYFGDSEGDNVYLINIGDGKDMMWNGATGTHVIKFGSGILLGEVKARFVQSGSALSVYVGYSNDNQNNYLRFDSNPSSTYFSYSSGNGMIQYSGITNASHYIFTLSDGSSISLRGLIENASIGTSGNDVLTPNSQNDAVFGGDGDDWITGKYTSSGSVYNNNILYGEGGDDRIDAGAGNDLVFGGSGSDDISGEAGDDTLYGDEGDDYIYGRDGNDILYGGVGNDRLYGDNNNDQLFGGDGTDVLSGGNQDDLVDGGNGDDIISAGSSYTLGDVVQGGKGNDQFMNSSGKTHYLFNLGDGQDVISDIGNSVLIDRFEFVKGSGIQLKDLVVTQVGNDLVIDAGAGDKITIKDWYLSPDNKIEEFVTYSSAGNAVVSTAAYIESMPYMTNHVPVVASQIPDTVANEGVAFTYAVPAGTFTDPDVGDALGYEATLADGSLLPGWLVFNSATKMFSGTPGIQDIGTLSVRVIAYDQLGEEATDVFSITVNTTRNIVTGTSDNDSLTGTAAADLIYGYGGNDLLDGSAGADALIGGDGDDTYVVDNVSDFIIENFNEGTDLVRSSVTYTINSNIENLTLTGTAVINGTGNNSDNVIVGNSAINTLTGGAGNDTLDGGAGADILIGGIGDDTYIVDNTGDVITENSNEGIDIVKSSVTYTLASNVENLAVIGAAAINGTGNTLNNILTGNSAANILSGGVGADTMVGGAGNDTYIVDNISDVVIENINEGTDLIQSSVTYVLGDNLENLTLTLTGTTTINGTGNDLDNILTGNSAVNILNGGAGNDTLNGGAGADTMIGGAGNDIYIVDIASDVVIENVNDGVDTVQSSVTYTLGNNVENLTLTGTTAINGTGNALDNVLIGNSAVNAMTGGAGNDTLDGGAGADQMSGGTGNDIYVVDNVSDVVTENANEGTDLVQSSVTYTIGNNVDNLTLTGTTAINGTGNALDNLLIGNSAINTLTGGAGNDTLDGGAGADKLTGGAGNDLYIVDNVSDVITEIANEGTDSVQSSVTFTLAANVENLTLTGAATINGTGNTLNNILIGNSANNTLSGGTGADTMSGGAGNDTYVVDNISDVVIENFNEGLDLVQSSVTYTLSVNVENLTLTGTTAINGTGNDLDNILIGNSAVNILNGGAGNDTLNGGTGADKLNGGTGNDIYVVDNIGDVVTENANEGIDTVQSSITYTLGNNVENLTLTGTTAINGTGNALDNILMGNSAVNTLTGGAGNDTLDGGVGADKLIGGAGDDTYVVDNVSDVITENANEGTDLAKSSVTYTLVANVENLTLTGTSAINGTGNILNNILVGNSAANTLTGGAGNDTLDGAAANDSLIGGTGNDSYLFGRGYGVDTVTENDATAGNTDIALFSASIAANQLWFQHLGNNLNVSIIGTTDSLVIKDWYLGSQYRVEQFKTADGKQLLDTQVESLVSAMAAFAPPAAGQTSLSPEYEAALTPVIAANWQ